MRERALKLNDGSTIHIHDDEWRSVRNEKKFYETTTEILRVTQHTSGLLTRVYAMRSVDGEIAAEQNIIVPADGPVGAAVAAAVGACAFTQLTA